MSIIRFIYLQIIKSLRIQIVHIKVCIKVNDSINLKIFWIQIALYKIINEEKNYQFF